MSLMVINQMRQSKGFQRDESISIIYTYIHPKDVCSVHRRKYSLFLLSPAGSYETNAT